MKASKEVLEILSGPRPIPLEAWAGTPQFEPVPESICVDRDGSRYVGRVCPVCKYANRAENVFCYGPDTTDRNNVTMSIGKCLEPLHGYSRSQSDERSRHEEARGRLDAVIRKWDLFDRLAQALYRAQIDGFEDRLNLQIPKHEWQDISASLRVNLRHHAYAVGSEMFDWIQEVVSGDLRLEDPLVRWYDTEDGDVGDCLRGLRRDLWA